MVPIQNKVNVGLGYHMFSQMLEKEAPSLSAAHLLIFPSLYFWRKRISRIILEKTKVVKMHVIRLYVIYQSHYWV